MEEVEKIKTLEKQMDDLKSTVYGTYKLIGSWGSGESKCPPQKQAGKGDKKFNLIVGGQQDAKLDAQKIMGMVQSLTDKLVQLDDKIDSERHSDHKKEVDALMQ